MIMQVLFSAAFIVQQVDNGPRFLVFFCLPPGKPRDIAFYPISALAHAKMAGIVNNVYCSSSGLVILGVQIVHIKR